MQLSLVFRAVLLLFLLALILGVECNSEKKSKRKRTPKCSGAGRKKKELWVTLDSTLNISTIASPCPSRSLSPWTYETSSDDSRIPQKISEAKCDHRGCITGDGEVDSGLESKSIYYQINVLKRVKCKKAPHYALKLETKIVSLGCTCVSPNVEPQN